LASINNIVKTFEKNGDENKSLKSTCAELIKVFSERNRIIKILFEKKSIKYRNTRSE